MGNLHLYEYIGGNYTTGPAAAAGYGRFGNMMVLPGASANQIEAVSFGEEKPGSAGYDDAFSSQNRRSDVVYKREQ